MDRSDFADAKRFRWLLEGNGYFLEERGLCGHAPTTAAERDDARAAIDERMMDDGYATRPLSIETAPIGVSILLFTPHNGWHVAEWDPEYWRGQSGPFAWMPLPAEPTETR